MKTHPSSVLLLAYAAAALPLAAQTASTAPKPAAQHRASATGATTAPHRPAASAAAACSKHPEVSSKVPALPAGAPCPKPLYTITTVPSVRLDYVSPSAGPDVATALGIESSTFSLDYVDTKVGTGEIAQPNKWYTIHYTGYLTDGTKFDSSVDRNDPITIQIGQHQVIPGWDTGFGGMRVGGKRRLYIPFQLAYGPNGRAPRIPPRAELIFDVEFISQSDTAPTPKTPPAPPTPPPAQPGAATQPGAAPSAPGTTPAINGAKPTTTTPPPPASPAGSTAPPPVTSATPAGTSTPGTSTPPKH